MNEQEQKMWFNFDVEQDLTGKADKFIAYLEDLTELTLELEDYIKNELQESKGEIIEEISDKIREKSEINRLYYEASHASMKNATIKYIDYDNVLEFIKLFMYYYYIEIYTNKYI